MSHAAHGLTLGPSLMVRFLLRNIMRDQRAWQEAVPLWAPVAGIDQIRVYVDKKGTYCSGTDEPKPRERDRALDASCPCRGDERSVCAATAVFATPNDGVDGVLGERDSKGAQPSKDGPLRTASGHLQ